MNKLTHRHLSSKQIPQERKSYKQVCPKLLVILDQGENVDPVQFTAAVEKSELYGEGGAFDGSAELLDELGGSGGGAPGGEEDVPEEYQASLLECLMVCFQVCLSVIKG